MSALAIAAEDVEAASTRLAGRVRSTPIRLLEDLGLLLKCEHEQLSGSFKIRGASNAVLARKPTGVVTGSSGNHGKALVMAARSAGVEHATVVMTADSAPHKRTEIQRLGGRVVDCPPGTEIRTATAMRIAAEQGFEFISSYDHPLVMAGQGTVGLEVARQVEDLETIVVPVGGGGLLAGVATAIRRHAPAVRVIGVEPAAGDDQRRSLAAGRRVVIPVPDTICDGVRAQQPGALTFPVIQALVDDIITASDDEVCEALSLLARAGIVAEPTAALAVAGARKLALGGATVVVITGGNVEPAAHARLIDGQPGSHPPTGSSPS